MEIKTTKEISTTNKENRFGDEITQKEFSSFERKEWVALEDVKKTFDGMDDLSFRCKKDCDCELYPRLQMIIEELQSAEVSQRDKE